MEITGWDTVVFTFTPPHRVFARLITSVLSRWPDALVGGLGSSTSPPQPVAGLPVERLPIGSIPHPIFYRDCAMAEHMDECAYVPMTDGDGPFAVIARERADIEFLISGLDELRASDHQRSGVQPPDPYRAWLCTPHVVEITTVTPSDPTSHPFSVWVLNEVKRACSG